MKRGQAALEFLTTYGWAFLVIIVMIGALAYFGVLNPSNLLPERCSFSTEMPCQDVQISSSGAVEFYLQNNVGNTASITEIIARSVDTNVPVSCTLGNGNPISSSAPLVIAPSGSSKILCTFSGTTFNAGGKAKILVNGNYTVTGGRFGKSFTGDIYAKVK